MRSHSVVLGCAVGDSAAERGKCNQHSVKFLILLILLIRLLVRLVEPLFFS
jgi:hypothetical protein